MSGGRVAVIGEWGREFDLGGEKPEDTKKWFDFDFHMDSIDCVALSHDGTILAASHRTHAGQFITGSEILVFELDSRILIGRMKVPFAATSCIAFSDDDLLLASGHEVSGKGRKYGEVILWNLPSCREKLRWATRKDRVYSLAFDPAGERLCVGENGLVSLYSANDGFLLSEFACRHRVLAVWFHPTLPQFRAADSGGSSSIPTAYLLEIVDF